MSDPKNKETSEVNLFSDVPEEEAAPVIEETEEHAQAVLSTGLSEDDIQALKAEMKLDMLKAQATTLKINFHPAIQAPALTAKIAAVLNADLAQAPATDDEGEVVESEGQRKARLRKEAMVLVRIIATCMNPNKRQIPGEIFSTGNSQIGFIKKYVPFNNEEGYHVPWIIYNHLKERECQIFIPAKSERGVDITIPKIIKEFQITKLEPITEKEIEDIRRRQLAQNTVD